MKHHFLIFVLLFLPTQLSFANQKNSILQISLTIQESCIINRENHQVEVFCSHDSPYKIMKEENNYSIVYF